MSNSRSYQPLLIADVLAVDSASPGLVSLASLAARKLPDGCQVFVVGNLTLYQLRKGLSTPAPGDLSGGQLGAMGGGVWVPVRAIGASPSSVCARNVLDKVVTLTGVGNPLVMPSVANSFVSVYDSSNWTVNTSTGQLEYLGPSGQPFFFSITASMYNGTTVIDTLMFLRAAGVLFDANSVITSPVTAGSSSFYQMSLSGILASLNNGDDIDVMFAGDSSTLTIIEITYTLIPLS
jgi:hypothetical protein